MGQEDRDDQILGGSLVPPERLEEHYRIALESARTGTFDLELATGGLAWSGALQQLLGLAVDSEPNLELLLSRVHPADRPKLEKHLAESLLTSRVEAFIEEFRVELPSRQVRWLLSRGQVLRDSDHVPLRLVGTLIDITPYKAVTGLLLRRAAQQKIVARLGRQALSNSDFEQLLTEAVGDVADALGVEFAAVFKLLPASEELYLQAGIGFPDTLSGLKFEVEAGSHLNYASMRQDPTVTENMVADQRFRPCHLTHEHELVSGITVPIRAEGQPWGLLSAYSRESVRFSPDDVHFLEAAANVLAEANARRQAEKRMQAAHNELEARVNQRNAQLLAANTELEAFAYSVSHDLRAPLRSLNGFSQVLLEDYSEALDETAEGYLQRIARAAARMDELIEDLLKLSRITSGTLQRKVADLTGQVAELVDELASREPTRNVRFDLQADVRTHADPRLVQIVLENLLGNAWKFTRLEREAIIGFGKTPSAKGDCFFVRDNGVGFDMTQAARLFTPFQRLHSREQFEGSGIGLATVERIIRKHGGSLRLESAPAEGTTVFFDFGAEPATTAD